MSLHFRTVLFCLIIATFVPIALSISKEKPADEAAKTSIRQMLDEQVAAWNRKSLEGYMEGFWNSPELTYYSGGTKVSGWQATIERYRKRYQGEGKEMGKLDFQELRIETLSPEIGFVRGRWHLAMSAGKDLGGLFTLIIKKFPTGWSIVHDHVSSECN